MDTAEYEIQEFSQNNQAISPKETLKTGSWGAIFGVKRTFSNTDVYTKTSQREVAGLNVS
jgi:hypothetical protein